ncbi:MAG: aldo/keto reductase [Planctomycetaceae bacterium]
MKRLKMDCVDLYYLHGPDPNCRLEESATAISRFLDQGLIKTVGLCNATLEEIQTFHEICPLSAYQGRFNMLQQEAQRDYSLVSAA